MLEFACSWQVCLAKACLLRVNACCFYRWWTGRGRSIDYSQRGGCRCGYLYGKQQHRFLGLARAATLSNGRTLYSTLLPQVTGFVQTQLSLLQDQPSNEPMRVWSRVTLQEGVEIEWDRYLRAVVISGTYVLYCFYENFKPNGHCFLIFNE